jgi:plastocyanin
VEFSATATTTGGGGGPPTTAAIQLRSDGSGNRFVPDAVTIAAGGTVTWTWASGFHDVTSTGSPSFTPSGAPVSAPNTYSQTFSTPGTYLYFCTIHGTPGAGMRGTIVVE